MMFRGTGKIFYHANFYISIINMETMRSYIIIIGFKDRT